MLRKRIARSLIVALLAASAASAASGAPASGDLHALVRTGFQMQLVRVDAAKLQPTGPRVSLGRNAGTWTYSPDGRQLAISTEKGIRFVDLRSRRLRATLARPHVLVRGLAWLAPRRLLLVEHGAVIRVDPARPRIVSQVVISGGSALAWAPTPSGVAVLTREGQGIGPPTLVAVGWTGGARSVTLERIQAGTYGGPNNEGPFRTEQPALAVDQRGGRAFVVGTGAVIASVNLATLRVSYHVPVAEYRLPAARAKAVNGSVRDAAWLGNDTLAMTGAELSTVGETASTTSTPIGLRLIDTGSWRSRRADPDASSVVASSGAALAFGVRWNGRGSGEGMGLAAYDSDGAQRYRVFEQAEVAEVRTGGGRAYFWADGALRAVDIASGRLVASARPRNPFVLLPR